MTAAHVTSKVQNRFALRAISFWGLVLRLFALGVLASGVWNLTARTYENLEFSATNPQFLQLGFMLEVIVGTAVLLFARRIGFVIPLLFACYSVISFFWWGSNQSRCPCLGPISVGTLGMAIFDGVLVIAMFLLSGHAQKNKVENFVSSSRLALIAMLTVHVLLASAMLAAKTGIGSFSQATELVLERGAIASRSKANELQISIVNKSDRIIKGVRSEASCECTELTVVEHAAIEPGGSIAVIAVIDATSGNRPAADTWPLKIVVFAEGGLEEEHVLDVPVVKVMHAVEVQSPYRQHWWMTPAQTHYTRFKLAPGYSLAEVSASPGVRVVDVSRASRNGTPMDQIAWAVDTSGERWLGHSSLELFVESDSDLERFTFVLPLEVEVAQYVAVVGGSGYLGEFDRIPGEHVAMEFRLRRDQLPGEWKVRSVKVLGDCFEENYEVVGDSIMLALVDNESLDHRQMRNAIIEFTFAANDKVFIECVSVRWTYR